jgi:hypothetical protein
MDRRRSVLLGIGMVLAGGALLAIPAGAEGPVLVPISEGHGLSALDSAGALLLAIGATWLEVLVVARLPRLGLPPRALFGLGVLAGLGVGLLLASVFTGFFWWWAVGAAALTIALVALVIALLRRGRV